VTTITQDAPVEEVDESLNLSQPCDGKHWIEEDCDNDAVYRCQTSCCKNIIYWCEECLFAFIKWASEEEEDITTGRCMFCNASVFIEPNFVKVIGRIK